MTPREHRLLSVQKAVVVHTQVCGELTLRGGLPHTVDQFFE
jgi:hypothetical protein